MRSLPDLIKAHGPCLSNDLTKLVADELGLSPVAARKRVSRGCDGLKRLAYLTFPRNARFLYLESDYGSERYWWALKEAVLASPAYGAALACLIQRQGIMLKDHFRIACGSPLKQKRHLSADAILDRLKMANVVAERLIGGVGVCVALAEVLNRYEPDIAGLRARMVTEAVLLKAVRMWARNLNLVSYDKVALRDEREVPPQVGTFAWDLSAPSYLAPMVEWQTGGKLSNGFVVCDVLLGSEVSVDGIRPFIQKCATLRSLKRVGRCLQIFVADSYSTEALSQARSAGIIPASPKALFGKEVADGLVRLTDVLTQAATASLRPEVFDELFNRLGQIEGAAGNLRGALFEFIVAELVRQGLGSNVRLNQIFRDDSGGEAEVDVVAEQGRRAVYFIECKGHLVTSGVEDSEIERWLTKRIPLVRRYALDHPEWRRMELHFELWTTGALSDAGKERVARASKATKKYKITLRDAVDVRKFAKEVNDGPLLKALTQHFLHHPLSTLDSARRSPASA